MTIPRFFLKSSHFDSKNKRVESTQGDLIRQVTKVLRLKPGDQVDFLDGQGQLFQCVLTSLDKSKLVAQIVKEIFAKDEANPQITIALSLLKGNRFDWALEKLTELGATKIVPLVFHRSVIRPQLDRFDHHESGSTQTKMRRWQSILKESAEQSERNTIPEITSPLTFSGYLAQCKMNENTESHFICAERFNAPYLDDSLGNNFTGFGARGISIVIGPEGGLTQEELDAALAQNFVAVSLGNQILRSETAAIYALAIVASNLCAQKQN